MKICLIYNFAQHYRASIFKLMSEEFDCDFVFGDSMGDVKKMDYTLLRGHVKETHTYNLLGGWTYQKGIVPLLLKKHNSYILLGDPKALSTWLFGILARILTPWKKVYFWSHGWYGKESRIESIIKKIFFHLPNGGVFLYGNYARSLMIEEGFNPNKLYTIHNSLAYEQQIEIRKQLASTPIFAEHFKNFNPNLFFIGRLTPVKKLDLILKAIAICKERGKNYNLTFIGGGEKMDELKALTSELGLLDRVWFYGPCYEEKELSNLIYNADLCVAPGNIGLTAMHSLVFGTPAITHDCYKWQMPEFEAIKPYKTGIFFEMDNVDSLASKIDEWFVLYSDLRGQIREQCFQEIDEQWNPTFQINVIKKVLG